MEHTHIGRYEVIRVLGQGAMGVVFEAHDPRLARRVAIKTIRADNLSPEQARSYEARFETEAHSVARLAHPNIVSVYDSGQIDATSYLVMEYVQGVTLKDCLRAGVRFSPWGAVRIVSEVLAALGHAHEQRILHRDIKPENILLDASGRVKLTDFGIAKMLDADVDNGTQLAGGSIGTPRYMSPEQVRGAPLDERSDLFSVGVLLYELLTGKPPFDGGSAIAIATAILHDQPGPPSAFGVPSGLDAVVGRALSKVASERFGSSLMFAQVLASVTADWAGPAFPHQAQGVAALVTDASLDALAVLQRELRAEAPGLQAAADTGSAPTAEASAPMPPGTPSASGLLSTTDGTRLYLSDAGTVRRVDAATGGEPGSSTFTAPPVAPGAASPRRRLAWLAAALSGAVVLAGVLWGVLRSPGPVPQPEQSPPGAAIQDPAQTLSDKEVLLTSPPTPPVASSGADAVKPGPATTGPAPVEAVVAPGEASANRPAAGARKPTGPATGATPAAVQATESAPSPPVPAAKPAAGVGASPAPAAPAAASPPVARRPTEPCTGMGFFERESCLWTQCRTDAYRKHPVCERFQDRSAPDHR